MAHKITAVKVSVAGEIATLLWIESTGEGGGVKLEIEDSADKRPLALVGGPGSSMGSVLARRWGNQFEAIAVFDKDLGGYRVETSKGGKYQVGDVIPATAVKNV